MELRLGRRGDGGVLSKEALLCCALLYFLFACTLFATAPTWGGSIRLDSRRIRTASYAQVVARGRRREELTSSSDGPGSYPPRCSSKCGDCTPCVPVHVAVPPGVPVPAEYYPEAWRCKCGNKLYMP